MSLSIYGSEIPDSSSGSDDDEVDDDFADYLETSILSQKEEEVPSSPVEHQKAKVEIFHYLPDELKYQIVTCYLPPALHKQVCKKYLVKLQQPQRCKIVSRLAYKLSDCSIRARPEKTTLPPSPPTIKLRVEREVTSSSSSSSSGSSSSGSSSSSRISPLPLSYVVRLEELIFSTIASKLLHKAYHTAVRKILTAFQLVRYSNGNDGPLVLYQQCLKNEISELELVNGILNGTINFANPERIKEIEAINKKRNLEVTLSRSRTAPPATEYNEPCPQCGGELYYSFKMRKQQVDRGRIILHCNSCSFITEL